MAESTVRKIFKVTLAQAGVMAELTAGYKDESDLMRSLLKAEAIRRGKRWPDNMTPHGGARVPSAKPKGRHKSKGIRALKSEAAQK